MTQNTAGLFQEALKHLHMRGEDGKSKPQDHAAAYEILAPLALGDSPEAGQAAFRLAQICIYILREEDRLKRDIPADETEKLNNALTKFAERRQKIEALHGEPITSETCLNWAEIGHQNGSPACSRICGDYYRYDAPQDSIDRAAKNNATAYNYYLQAANGGDKKGAFRALKMQAYLIVGVPHDPETMLALARDLYAEAETPKEQFAVTGKIFAYLKRLEEQAWKEPSTGLKTAFIHAVLTSGVFDGNKKPESAPAAESVLTLEDVGPCPGGSISDNDPAP